MIEEIRKIAINKKEQLINEKADLSKINNILNLLEDDMCFFKININVAVPILYYIGIPETQIKDVYFKLINSNNYKEKITVREGIDINRFK